MRDQEWLADRIWDIMNCKKISLQKLAPLVGLKYGMELQRYLNGKNYFTPQLLGMIASALGVSIARLEQTDYEVDQTSLREALRNGKITKSARRSATDLVRASVGLKELANALRDMGWMCFLSKKKEWALMFWQKSFDVASKRDKRTKGVIDKDLMFRSLMDMTVYFVEKKQYEVALGKISDAENFFPDDPEKLGMIHQQKGLCLSRLGEKDQAKSNYLLAQDLYRQSGNNIRLGRIQANLASLEYHAGNIDAARLLIEEARKNSIGDTGHIQVSNEKDYAKVLIAKGEERLALEVALDCLKNIDNHGYCLSNELLGQILLICCDLSRDPIYGERIMSMQQISRELTCNIAEILMLIYIEQGDKDLAFKYHKVMKHNIIQGIEDYKNGAWFG